MIYFLILVLVLCLLYSLYKFHLHKLLLKSNAHVFFCLLHLGHKKLMNIKLKDYKNEFLNIEIEIIPKENIYGQFINHLNKNINIYLSSSAINIIILAVKASK